MGSAHGICLVVDSAQNGRRTVELDRAPISIGRVPDNDVQLLDEQVSRHHALIERDAGGRVVLRDLDSRNGTYVDGERLRAPRVLHGGERVRIGGAELRLDAGRTPAPGDGAPAASAAGDGAPLAPVPARGARPAPAPAGAGEAPPVPAPAPPAEDRPGAVPERRRRVGRRGAVALGVLAVIALLGVAQLLLPGIAEDRLRSSLTAHGRVTHLSIEALPAVELLFHRADDVAVAMDSYSSEPSGGHGSLASFLNQTRDVGSLHVTVAVLHSRLVTLHDVELRKQGDVLQGSAQITQQELDAALPGFVNIRPVSASEDGILAEASLSAFGHSLGVRLVISAEGGVIVVRPAFALASFAKITVFSDPGIYVESLGAKLQGETYLLDARARLR